MRIRYDGDADALYLELSDAAPEGVVEMAEGVNLDTTSDGRIVGIEILQASRKIDVRTILSYTLELDKDLITQKTA